MATTPIYGFETPDDTDLVKDGALAIRTALDDVDTTLGTALNSNDYAGLVLVKKQTIGSAVSSVTVTGAFSATYENYKIIVTGGVASAAGNIRLKIGSATTAYYTQRIRLTTSTGLATNTSFNALPYFDWAGTASTNNISMNLELLTPFLTKHTSLSTTWTTTNATTNTDMHIVTGYLGDNTSHSEFNLTHSTGTMTGGTIYVYGYGAS
jgi:hypothetical protein